MGQAITVIEGDSYNKLLTVTSSREASFAHIYEDELTIYIINHGVQ